MLAGLLRWNQPGPSLTSSPAPLLSLLEGQQERIEAWLSKEQLQLTRVHELLLQQGIVVSYTTLRRFVRRAGLGKAPRGTLRMAAWPPGEVAEMDIRMPGMDRLAATRLIAEDEHLREMRVVILRTFDLDEYVFEALRLGASWFLVKDTRPAELVQAIRVVAEGDALLSPHVTRRLIGRFASQAKAPPAVPSLDSLTDREKEVVALVAEGLSNEEIAGRLVLSPRTAKTHVSRAMVKLNARDRAQLVVFAYESGLARPGWLE